MKKAQWKNINIRLIYDPDGDPTPGWFSRHTEIENEEDGGEVINMAVDTPLEATTLEDAIEEACELFGCKPADIDMEEA